MPTPMYDVNGNLIGVQPDAQAPAAPDYSAVPDQQPTSVAPAPTSGLSPDAVWNANVQQESGGRAGAIGQPTPYGTALGATQLLPQTAQEMAQKIGVAYNPALLTAKTPAAKDYQLKLGRAYFDEGWQRYGGNPQKALMYYHGGPNEKLWGPKTQAHAAAVLQRVSNVGGGPSQGPAFDDGGVFGSDPGASTTDASGNTAPAFDDGGVFSDATTGSNTPDDPSAQPTPQNNFQNNLGVTNAKTGSQATQAQAATYRQLQKDGRLDTNAQPGSVQLPLLATNETDVPDPGQWFVDIHGTVRQVPGGAQKTDEGLGFYQGFMHPFDSAARGLEMGYNGTLGKVFGEDHSVERARADHQQYIQDQIANGKKPGMIGQIAGDIASPTSIAMMAVAPEGRIAQLGHAVATGGMMGALDSDQHTAGGIAADAVTGAALGGATHGVLNKVAGAVSPRVNAVIQRLQAAGVPLTPGQIGGGLAKVIEDKATSIPFLGDAINTARARGFMGFNRGAYNQALTPLGKSLPEGVNGTDALKFVQNKVNNAFENIKPGITVKPDTQFATDVSGIARDRVSVLPDKEAAQYGKIFANKVANNVDPKTGLMTGDMFKKTDSELGRMASDYSASADADQRQLGYALHDTQAALRDMMGRQNPSMVDPVNNANRAYAMYTRLRDVAGKTAVQGNDGIFSPYQLLGSIRSGDKSFAKRAFGEGDALLQQYAKDGHAVLPNKVPNSGTADRLLQNTLVTGGILGGGEAISHGALGHMLTTPWGLIGGAAGVGASIPYANATAGKVVEKALTASRGKTAAAVGDAIRQGNRRAGGLIGGAVAQQYRKEKPGTPAPIEIDINQSTNPDVIAWRRAHGLPDLPKH